MRSCNQQYLLEKHIDLYFRKKKKKDKHAMWMDEYKEKL